MLRFASGDEGLRATLYEEFGDQLFSKFPTISTALEKRLDDWGSDEDEGDDEEGGGGRVRPLLRAGQAEPAPQFQTRVLPSLTPDPHRSRTGDPRC